MAREGGPFLSVWRRRHDALHIQRGKFTLNKMKNSKTEHFMNIKDYDFYYHLRVLPFVEAIWLYGSRARGEGQSRSDIDLAILCPKATEEEWFEIREIINTADTLFHIDCLRFDALPKGDKLQEAILRDKMVLFERKSRSYAWYESFLDLGEAIDRLDEASKISEDVNSFIREVTIQRFETTVELFWKVLKKICNQERFEVNSPRATLQKSFELKLIDDEKLWLNMLDDRNLTSHTYNLPLAKEIYYRIKPYVDVMKKAFETIKKRYDL